MSGILIAFGIFAIFCIVVKLSWFQSEIESRMSRMASNRDVERVAKQLECNHVVYEPEVTEWYIKDDEDHSRPSLLRCSNCDYIVARGYAACESLLKEWNETMIKRHQSKIDSIDSLNEGDKE